MSLGRVITGPQKSDSVQTTDATADVLLIEVPIPDKFAGFVALSIIGMHSVDSLYYDGTHAVMRNGVAATYLAAVGTPDRVDTGSAAWVITVDCNGVNLRVRVTGEAAHTINWSCADPFAFLAESFT